MIDINELISARYSPKRFSSKAIEKEKTELLFEAARWAPSCYNDQPWRFVYCTKDIMEKYDKLISFLAEANQEWAKSAYMLVLSIASINFGHNNKSNRFAAYDTGMAVGNLILQATDMGLFVHQMGGYDIDKVRELIEIPNDFEILSIMAIGYLDEEFLTESLDYKNNRKRKEKEAIVFKGKFLL
jgi:nitroreductase